MNNLIFTHDFLFHSYKSGTYHKWVFDLFRPFFEQAVFCEPVELKSLCTESGYFSRDVFFELSGIDGVVESYFNYDEIQITEKSIEYLKQFLPAGSFVLGIELGEKLRKILDSIGCKYLNIAFHSFKLFDDIPLLFNTNDKEIYGGLEKYKIPHEKFNAFAHYWKIYINENGLVNNDIKKNSVLFIGQTLKDMSVVKDDKFLNVTDFGDCLSELSSKYNKVYFLPHPKEKRNKNNIEFVKKYPNTEILKNENVYTLLANENIQKVVGISSSVLFEAQFFGKDFEYLHKPLYHIDEPFENDSFVSVYNEFFSPIFWKEILGVVFKTKENCDSSNYFENGKNKLRNVKDLYWAYAGLDDVRQLALKVNPISLKRRKKLFSVKKTENRLRVELFGVIFSFKRNKKLNSGERQVFGDVSMIRPDHLSRYNLSLNYIEESDSVLDCACGVGYGSYILSNAKPSSRVLGVDISKDAISFANENYKTNNNKFLCSDILSLDFQEAEFDKIVSFETIEHIEKDSTVFEFFCKWLKPNGLLILSTPNEALLPFNKKQFPFHVKHYLPQELETLLEESGFEIMEVFSQKTNTSANTSSCFENGWGGVFNTVIAKKKL